MVNPLLAAIRADLRREREHGKEPEPAKTKDRPNPLDVLVFDHAKTMLSSSEFVDMLEQGKADLPTLLFVDYFLDNSDTDNSQALLDRIRSGAGIDSIAKYASISEIVDRCVQRISNVNLKNRLSNDPDYIEHLPAYFFVDHYLSNLGDNEEANRRVIRMLEQNQSLSNISQYVAQRVALNNIVSRSNNCQSLQERLLSTADPHALKTLLFIDTYMDSIDDDKRQQVEDMLASTTSLSAIANQVCLFASDFVSDEEKERYRQRVHSTIEQRVEREIYNSEESIRQRQNEAELQERAADRRFRDWVTDIISWSILGLIAYCVFYAGVRSYNWYVTRLGEGSAQIERVADPCINWRSDLVNKFIREREFISFMLSPDQGREYLKDKLKDDDAIVEKTICKFLLQQDPVYDVPERLRVYEDNPCLGYQHFIAELKNRQSVAQNGENERYSISDSITDRVEAYMARLDNFLKAHRFRHRDQLLEELRPHVDSLVSLHKDFVDTEESINVCKRSIGEGNYSPGPDRLSAHIKKRDAIVQRQYDLLTSLVHKIYRIGERDTSE